MTRFQFGGYGTPIPESADVGALDPHIHPDLPVQSFVLVDGDVFRKVDWASLGYTNYEVWCVGGAGGQGGNASRKYYWQEDVTPETIDPANPLASFSSNPMPADVFTAWKEMLLYTPWTGYQGITGYNYPGAWTTEAQYRAHYFQDSVWHVPAPGEKLPPVGSREYEDYRLFGGWNIYTSYYTFDQYANFVASHADWLYNGWEYWKAHQSLPHVGFRRYMGLPMLINDGSAIGGAGGGGGVQVVSGLLEDLPDAIPVSVGQGGTPGLLGHIASNGPFTPATSMLPVLGQDPQRENAELINPQLWEATYRGWTDNYPLPHPTFVGPGSGQDGGPSSFGDICMASGGKGGSPATTWIAGKLHFAGQGGEGGKGGTLVAGGGGAGGYTEVYGQSGQAELTAPRAGKDGTWDGHIGTGGGGGAGGGSEKDYKYLYVLADGSTKNVRPLYGQYSTWPYILSRDASGGGKGAYSKLDTSVYGEAGFIEPLDTPTVYGGAITHGALIGGVPYYPVQDTPTPMRSIFPAPGGGARVNRKYRVGSWRSKHDSNWSPDGLVLLRLIRVEG